MVIGDPLDEATDIGTIVSPGQFERVRHYVGLAEATTGLLPENVLLYPSMSDWQTAYSYNL